jgi:hypothetical protein
MRVNRDPLCVVCVGTNLGESPDGVVLAPFKEPGDLEKEEPWSRRCQCWNVNTDPSTNLSASVILPNHGRNVSAKLNLPYNVTKRPKYTSPETSLKYPTRFLPDGRSRFGTKLGSWRCLGGVALLNSFSVTSASYSAYSRNGPTRKPGK